jgi:hypothetical protein
MFVFRESPIFAKVAVSSLRYDATADVLGARVASGFTTHCSKGILFGEQRGVNARKLRRERNNCAHTGNRPALRTECSVTQHALSPP